MPGQLPTPAAGAQQGVVGELERQQPRDVLRGGEEGEALRSSAGLPLDPRTRPLRQRLKGARAGSLRRQCGV